MINLNASRGLVNVADGEAIHLSHSLGAYRMYSLDPAWTSAGPWNWPNGKPRRESLSRERHHAVRGSNYQGSTSRLKDSRLARVANAQRTRAKHQWS